MAPEKIGQGTRKMVCTKILEYVPLSVVILFYCELSILLQLCCKQVYGCLQSGFE